MPGSSPTVIRLLHRRLMKSIPCLGAGGAMQDKKDGEREVEERTMSISRLLIQDSLFKTQVSWQVLRWSRSWQTSAVLVVTDFHVGQPHRPSVPRPVADYEGLTWHLIPGIH